MWKAIVEKEAFDLEQPSSKKSCVPQTFFHMIGLLFTDSIPAKHSVTGFFVIFVNILAQFFCNQTIFFIIVLLFKFRYL